MQRYFALIVLLLFSFPVGLSITGCTTNVAAYCNNAGYGSKLTDIAHVSLTGGTTGISLAYGQISTAGSASATNCKGSSLSTGTPTYGSSNLSLADINPTSGALCAGTWNRLSPGGIPDFTICTPPAQPGVAQVTASIGGVSSNPVNVYVHPAISSITIPAATACVGQNVVGTIPLSAGTQIFDTNAALIPLADVGTINYTAVTPSIVAINNTSPTASGQVANGVTTAGQPGGTVITATISRTTSSAGYFFTCPPQSIQLTLNGQTSGTIAGGNPQNLTATIPDTNGNLITGLVLDYTSTQPTQIAVSAGGTVSSSFPGSSAITAICQPGTCNPAPINKIGTFGTGLPIVSNRIGITSPGTGSTLLWAASPQSQFFTPFDLSLGTTGSPVRLPYVPNSMVLDQVGADLYFGSYRELMVYSTTTNGLSREDTSVPGVVLAVSPDSSTLVINDQLRQVIYLYNASTHANTSIGGLATHAVFSPDSKNVYIVGPAGVYVHNSNTGWSTYPVGAQPSGQSCTLDNSGNQPFCSPDVTLTVPAVAPFFSGANTIARSFCPNDTLEPGQSPFYPPAATVAAQTDHLAASDDGAHVVGATTTTITDIQHAPTSDTSHSLVPAGSCPYLAGAVVDPLAGAPLSLATNFNQLPLTGIAATQINQVLPSPDSSKFFITYAAAAATGLLPVYTPSATPGAAGALATVQLATGAQAPISGIFSPDVTTFFVSTTGDNLIHQLLTGTLKEAAPLNPLLRNTNNQFVPAQFLAVKPRATT